MWLLDIRERSDERQREHKRIVPLELALEHKIVAQRLSGRCYFAGLPDAWRILSVESECLVCLGSLSREDSIQFPFTTFSYW